MGDVMSWIVTLFLAVFVSVGLYFIGKGIHDIALARQSSSWPQAPALILESKVTTSRSSKGGRSYKAAIRYTYVVNGAPLTSSKIFFGDGISAGSAYANAIAKRHPDGAQTIAYHHPERPALAVLEPGLTKRSFITAAFGFIFFAIGSGFGLLYWLTH